MTESFILGALRRERSVEQLLEPCGPTKRPGVRHVEVRATKTSHEVLFPTAENNGSENFFDLGQSPPFDPDDEARELGRLPGKAEDPLAAPTLAEQRTGAERGRRVNAGIVQNQYGDFARAGRPSAASPTAGRGLTCRTLDRLARDQTASSQSR
ncbi:hypothetical protein [Streptomyces sp. NPDC055186]